MKRCMRKGEAHELILMTEIFSFLKSEFMEHLVVQFIIYKHILLCSGFAFLKLFQLQ